MTPKETKKKITLISSSELANASFPRDKTLKRFKYAQ
jgi:hypothetical protein